MEDESKSVISAIMSYEADRTFLHSPIK